MAVVAGAGGMQRPDQQFRARRRTCSKSLNRISLVRCDEAAWRFLGLSLAGWDVLVSLGLALTALWGGKAALAQARRSD